MVNIAYEKNIYVNKGESYRYRYAQKELVGKLTAIDR